MTRLLLLALAASLLLAACATQSGAPFRASAPPTITVVSDSNR